MLRRIIGITGISLWAGLIVIAAIWGFQARAGSIELTEKPPQESGDEAIYIEALAKDLVDSLASGDYQGATENFDETMKRKLPVEKLQEVWGSLIAGSGAFVEQLGTRREKIMGYDVIFVTCKFENGVLDTKVVFDSNKQVAGLFFVPSKGSAK